MSRLYGRDTSSKASRTISGSSRATMSCLACSRVMNSTATSHLNSVSSTRFRPSSKHLLTREFRGLADPTRHEFLVDRVTLVNVIVTHVLLPGLDRREGAQRRAAEERHLDVLRDAVEPE